VKAHVGSATASLTADGARRGGLCGSEDPYTSNLNFKANVDKACGGFGRWECCWGTGFHDATGRRWLGVLGAQIGGRVAAFRVMTQGRSTYGTEGWEKGGVSGKTGD
jgi:hypothetical protein